VVEILCGGFGDGGLKDRLLLGRVAFTKGITTEVDTGNDEIDTGNDEISLDFIGDTN